MGRRAESSRLVLATPARHAATDDDGSSANGARTNGSSTNGAIRNRPPAANGSPNDGRSAAANTTTRVAPTGRGHDDIVIDLTGPEPAVVTAAAVRRWRRWAMVLGVVAVVAVVLAVMNFSVGMQWRSRALAAQQRAQRAVSAAALTQGVAARARSEVTAAERREKAMARRLAVSEADVDALEARIAKLASAKAEAEDGGTAAGPSVDRAHLRTLRAQLDACITQVSALRATLAEGAAPAAVHDAARAAEVACEQAGSDAAVLTRR